MEKIIISSDIHGTLSAKYYQSERSVQYNNIFFHEELNNVINIICRYQIDSCYADNLNLIINTKSTQVIIRNYNHLLNTKLSLEPLRFKIKTFLERENLRNKRIKKVKRNSRIGTAILTAGLVITLISGVNAITKKDNDIKEEPAVTYEQVQEAPQETYHYVFLNNEQEEEPEALNLVNDNSKKTSSNQTKEETTEENVKQIKMSFASRIDTDKANTTRSNYQSIITSYANTYGIDPQIMLAIATQERGIHSNQMDEGGGIGLMQVQYSVWVNQDITAYNFDTQNYETLHIDENNIGDLDTNIKIACMIYQGNLISMNYNIPASLQAYNWGFKQAKDIISNYGTEVNQTFKELINNYEDTSWLNRFETNGNIYSNLVLSYLDTSKDITNLKYNKDTNEVSSINYHINNSYQKSLNIN